MICGKQIFPSRDEAAAAMVGVNKDKRPGRSANRLNTSYFCNDCQGWHIASRSNRKNKKGRTTEFKESAAVTHNKKMKDHKTLIIRNYTSKPI